MPSFDDFFKWIGFFKGYPLGYVLLALLLIVLFFWPEKVFFWISKCQTLFLFLGTGMKKKQIETEIKANILKASKEISKELDDVMPYDLKINWVKSSSREAFFDGKNVIVCMNNDSKNRMHAVVHAINDYVTNGLLIEEKAYIEKNIMKSSCLVMTRKLLMQSFEKGISYFYEEILKKEYSGNDDLKIMIDKLISLDENGLFTQVMLREIKEKGSKMLGKINIDKFEKETISFVQYLHKVAIRNIGDDSTPLTFKGSYYKVSILLVANLSTYYSYGIESYLKRFSQNLKEGTETVYICARNKNKPIAIKVYKEICNSYNVMLSKEFHFKGTSKNGDTFDGICIPVKVKEMDKANNQGKKVV